MRTCRCCKGSGAIFISVSPFETQLCPRCLGCGCEGQTGPALFGAGTHPRKVGRQYPKGISKDIWDRISDRVEAYQASQHKHGCPYQRAVAIEQRPV